MAELSDLQLATILDEIASSMRAGTPIGDAMRRLQTRQNLAVKAASAEIADRLERGEDLSAAVASIDSPISAQAATAVGVCHRSGDPGLLKRLASQLRRRGNGRRRSQLAWFYPLMLAAVAYGVGVVAMAPLIRRFHDDGIGWPAWVIDVANWLTTGFVFPPLVISAIVIAIVVWRSRRQRFSADERRQLFCESLANQLRYDVPEDQAIKHAAVLSDDRELMSLASPTLDSPPLKRLLSQSELAMIDGVDRKANVIAQLTFVASLYAQRARVRQYWWTHMAPRLTMIAVGGGMILGYAWFVIAPVYRQVLP